MDAMEKLAAQSLEEALAVARAAGSTGLRIKLAASVPGEVKMSRRLKVSAGNAWNASPPKPKTHKPGRAGQTAKETVKASPPSKTQFYEDMQMNPQRGNRLGVA